MAAGVAESLKYFAASSLQPPASSLQFLPTIDDSVLHHERHPPQRGDVFRLVLRQGMLVAAVGAGVGVLGALGVSRFLQTLLFEVSPADPATFAAVVVILGGAAFAACYLPARRATRVDPMVALRNE